MKSDCASADAVYVRGLCLYYKDNLDKGITHFQQVLTLDPDHSKAKVMRIKAKNLKEKKENGNFSPVIFGKDLLIFVTSILSHLCAVRKKRLWLATR